MSSRRKFSIAALACLAAVAAGCGSAAFRTRRRTLAARHPARLDLLGLMVPEEADGSGATMLISPWWPSRQAASWSRRRSSAPRPAPSRCCGAQSAELLARVHKGAVTVSVLNGDGFELRDRTVTGTSLASLQGRSAGTFLLRAREANGSAAIVCAENGAGSTSWMSRRWIRRGTWRESGSRVPLLRCCSLAPRPTRPGGAHRSSW
jgi:hypothetical protein